MGRGRGKKTPIERFLSKVDKTGTCWLWTGSKGVGLQAYGHFYWPEMSSNRKCLPAHRAAYLFWNGLIPTGMLVCHSCDNPPCVNPAHLWLGTHKDNNADKYAKGRQGNVGLPKGYKRWWNLVPDPEEKKRRARESHKRSTERAEARIRAKYGPKEPKAKRLYRFYET